MTPDQKTPEPAKKPSVTEILDAVDASAAAPKTEEGEKKPRAKKSKKTVLKARACIYCGENNTIVSITDGNGNVLAWSSSGSAGFKGARKATPYAAKVAAERAMNIAQPYGIQELDIEVKGIGPGREQAIRGLQTAGINFNSITDRTPVAHGGCRPPKPRRI